MCQAMCLSYKANARGPCAQGTQAKRYVNKYKRVRIIIDELRWKWEKPGLELFYPTLNTREWVLFPPGICKISEDKNQKTFDNKTMEL